MPVNEQAPHKHNTDEFFNILVENAKTETERNPSSGLESDNQLNDNYQPEEEKIRIKAISSILCQYENAYKNKVEFQDKYRRKLFWGCAGIVILFVIIIAGIILYAVCNAGSMDFAGMVAIITAVVSLVVSIIELVQIITTYCFPENDEEYIVKIVKSIQENDLARMKELNRATEARNKDG